MTASGLRGRSAMRRSRILLLVPAFVVWPVVSATPQSQAAPRVLADRIVVVKSTRTMALMRKAKVLKVYKVALGTQPLGAKERVGDHKTPEGNYIVDAKKERSAFHRALHSAHRRFDWTDGCIAVTNEEIDEIFTLVRVGTPIEIEP